MARFTGADSVGDVHVDGRPINSLSHTALCGLHSTVTVVEVGQDVATKSHRDHHQNTRQDKVPVYIEVFPYLPA